MSSARVVPFSAASVVANRHIRVSGWDDVMAMTTMMLIMPGDDDDDDDDDGGCIAPSD